MLFLAGNKIKHFLASLQSERRVKQLEESHAVKDQTISLLKQQTSSPAVTDGVTTDGVTTDGVTMDGVTTDGVTDTKNSSAWWH